MSRYGISPSHAYSILDTKVYKGEKLIKLRNPWSKEKYTGPWSDSDTKRWTAEAKKAFGHTSNDDGVFWMPYKYFSASFDNNVAVGMDEAWKV